MSKRDEEMEKEGYYIEETNKCPLCNSKRISKINTYQVYKEVNLSSGKILKKNTTLTPFGRIFHNYKCRKCGWTSVTFDE